MSSGRAGIQRIALCDLGTLGTTPANAEFFGFGGEKKINITPFKQTDIYPEKKGRNMENHNITGDSEQATMKMMKNMISFLNFNCDAEVVTAKQSSAANSEEVYKYAGNDCMGLMWKYESNRDKQILTPTLDRAFDYEYSKTLKDAAATATPATFTGITDPGGRDISLRQSPNKLVLQSGGSDIFTEMGINSRSMIIETIEASRNQYNAPQVDLLKILIEIIANESQVAKIVSLMAKNNTTNILWKETTTGLLYKAFDFNTNILFQTEEEPLGDKERNIKLVYQGAEWIHNITFEFGTGKGGSAEDTVGTTGGTMKFGY
jgi:hypothetical protein